VALAHGVDPRQDPAQDIDFLALEMRVKTIESQIKTAVDASGSTLTTPAVNRLRVPGT